MARNPIERALGVWSAANYRNVMLPGLGVVTCGELCDALADIKAENEEQRERLIQFANAFDAGYAAAERALAERPRGVNEDALRALAQAYDREDSAQRGEPDPWNLDDPGDIGDSDTWVSERLACARVAAEAFLSALEPAAPEGRQDDEAVDRFAQAMKAKLERKRAEGRGGWHECSAEYLSELLIEHVKKGDPVDVANLAMMLHQNGQRIIAPEGRQDNKPRAYIVHPPEDDYYGTGPDRLQFHPLAQHDLDNGYRQTPLYGRPAPELSWNTGELIDKMAEAIRGDTVYDDTPWITLSEDHKIGWRGDAERALAVVKEYLTARRPAAEAEPAAAYTIDYLGCEYVSRDVESIKRVAARGDHGPTEVVYLYEHPAAVTDATVEAVVQAVRPYTMRTLFIDEHRELVRGALKAAMEAGRHE